MTHDELVDIAIVKDLNKLILKQMKAIDAVVELHKPLTSNNFTYCPECQYGSQAGGYPCETIQAIEKKLN